MSYYEKTVLSCYNALLPMINQIENLIKQKAKNSYYNFSPCQTQAEDILKLIEARVDLFDLKSLTEEALSKIPYEDLYLLKYRFFGEKPNFEFDHTSRNYFRKQNKALEKFLKALNSIELTEKWFTDKYLKMPFIKNVHKKIILEEGKKHVIG